MKTTLRILTLALALAGQASAEENPIAAADSAPASVETLDQRVRIVERKLELADEALAAAKKEATVVTAGPGGIAIQSADKKYGLKLGGLLQTDARIFAEDNNSTVLKSNDILIRRARINTDATLGDRLKLRLVAELAGTQASLVDAYADLKLLSFLSARIGRFKTPISLENFRSDPARDFVEAAFPLGLSTVRDNGIWLEASDTDGAISLGAGVVNGGLDGGTTVGAAATQDDKDAVAKLFIHPLRFFDTTLLRDFGFGVAGSSGHRSPGSAPDTYKTTNQQSLTGYKALTTVQDDKWRVVPQAYLFHGPFSLIGEYARSVENLSNTTNAVRHTSETAGREAWQVSAGWVLTGEDAAFSGTKWNKDSTSDWGSLQLVGRYQEFAFDDASFNHQPRSGANAAGSDIRFLDPRKTPRRIQGWGVGLNWLATPNTKIYLDWEENTFTDGATKSAGSSLRTVDRDTEKSFFARAQFAY